MRSKRTRLTRRSLIVGVLTAIVFLALSQATLATATTAFTLKLVDKGGTTQTLGTWTYDAVQQSFFNGAAEAPFVQTFSPYLRYSGRDSGFVRLAVVTKGITIADLVDYAEDQTGIPLGDATAMGTQATDDFASSRTVGSMSGRYYYPSYIIDGTWNDATRSLVAPVLGITSYGIRDNQTTDRGWGIPALVTLNGGSIYPDPTDNATLDGGFALLTAAADSAKSLNLLQGQTPGTPEANLGSMSASLVDAVTFTPVYETITANVTDGGTATVTTDDGYLKATATEPVSFTVSDVTPGYHVDTVAVTDASSGPVTVNDVSGTYSFTMPATDATITVTLAEDLVVGIAATHPASGARWRTGTTQLVRFTVQGPFSGGEFGVLLIQGGATTMVGTLATVPGQRTYAYGWLVAGDPGAAEMQIGWRPTAGSGVWTVMSTSTRLTILRELSVTVTSPGADSIWSRGSVQKVKWALQDPYRNGRFTLILRDAKGRAEATRTVDVKRGATTYSAGLRVGKSLRRGTSTVMVRWSAGSRSTSGRSPEFRVK